MNVFWKRVILLILWCWLPVIGFASDGAFLFVQAQDVAEKEPLKARKLFQLAGLKFEELAQVHPEVKADALYNAGNAYFFAEEQGRALHAYRRAEQLLPFNRELKDNIAYLIQLHEEEKVTPKRRILAGLRAVFSFRVCVVLALLFYFSAIVALGLWQWRTKTNWSVFLASVGMSLLFLVVVLGTLFRGPQNGVVLSFQAEARKGDGYVYAPAFADPLSEATEFRVAKIRGDWVLAVLPDGSQGWLAKGEVGLW